MQRRLALIVATVLFLGAFVGVVQQQVAAGLEALAGDVEHELVAVPGDGQVDFAWTLTNRGDATINLEYGYGQIEFIVRQDGEEIWRWTDDRAFIMVLLTKKLGPGEQLELSGYWDAPETGTYTVEGVFTPTSGPKFSTEPVEFTVGADVMARADAGDVTTGDLPEGYEVDPREGDVDGREFEVPPGQDLPDDRKDFYPGDAGEPQPHDPDQVVSDQMGELVVTPGSDGIDFAWTITNTGEDPLYLEYGYPDIEFTVQDSSGSEVWRWTEGKVFIMILLTRELAPGESLTFEGHWEDPVPGVYAVQAEFKPSDGPIFRSPHMRFEVK